MKAGWLVLPMVAVILGCDDSPKPMPEGTLAVRIKWISSDVVDVGNADGDVLTITHFKKTIWDGKNWTWNYLNDALRILSRLDEAAKGKQYKNVIFLVRIPTRDNLGREGDALGMKVKYDLSALSGANWKNMTTFDIGEVAEEIVFTRIGSEAALEYCKDGDHVKWNPKFCRGALARMR